MLNLIQHLQIPKQVRNDGYLLFVILKYNKFCAWASNKFGREFFVIFLWRLKSWHESCYFFIENI